MNLPIATTEGFLMPVATREFSRIGHFLRLRQAIALPVYAVGLLLAVLVVIASASWPARSERQRRLLDALSYGLAEEHTLYP